MVTPQVFLHRVRVQTLASVVHATGGEDTTPRRTHTFLSLVVSSTRTPEHFSITHVRVAQVCTSLHLRCFEWFAPLRIQNTSSSLMSHPNLPGLHPGSFTSCFSSPSQPPQTTCVTKLERASLTEIRYHLSATSPVRQSGYLADSIPLTGLKPKTCIDVRSEHTAINYTYRKNNFNIEDNVTATVAASETSDGFQKQAAAGGSSQFVPTSEVNA